MARMLGLLAVCRASCACPGCGDPSRSGQMMRVLRRREKRGERQSWRRDAAKKE